MQKRLGWMLGITLLISGWAGGAAAQADRLADVRFMEGHWQAQRFLLDADQNWVPTEITAIEFERIYSGQFIQARMQLPDLQWQVVLGLDPLKSRYRLASMSSDNGQLAVFEGQFTEKEGLTLDNAVTDTAFKGPKGKYYLRYRFKAEADDQMILTTYRAAAQEMEWRPVSRVVFKRP